MITHTPSIRGIHLSPRGSGWLLVPLLLSIALHVGVLAAIQALNWFSDAQEPPPTRLLSFGVDPRDSLGGEPFVMITRPSPPGANDGLSNVGNPAANIVPPAAVHPAPRYPEEDLPILSVPGPSDRSRMFVRDGELNAMDPGTARMPTPERRLPSSPVEPAALTLEPVPASALAAGTAAGLGVPAPGPPPHTGLTPPSAEPVPAPLTTFKISPSQENLLRANEPETPALPMPVEIKLEVYSEPGSDYRFFRMTLDEKADAGLPVMTKNVLFLVDISSSIRREMLQSVQKAILDSAGAFRPNDRFNLIRFSEESYRSFPSFVPATKGNLAAAAAQVQKEPGQIRTDVYQSVSDVVAALKSEDTSSRPTLIYLITDGNATAGIQDLRRIVNDLSGAIPSTYSIFAVNPGVETSNRYLLDLLAYCNRGGFVSSVDAASAAADITKLLDDHKSPVLMNLRAQYGNFEAAEVYPEMLPNLYEGHPVVIHGRCRPGEKIAVRLIGSGVDRFELIYVSELPKVTVQDAAIAKEWARGRIHQLAEKIAREGQTKQMLDEIRQLSAKYSLESPKLE